MGLFFRRVISFPPLRLNLSKSGAGVSIGFPGLRIGRAADGRRYISVGIPGTGIRYVKYFAR